MLAQYNWELEKDKDGIQVYSSELKDFPFRVTKVECILEGDYEQLIEVIADVEGMTDWVFKSSSCEKVETYGELDFLYVVITDMPWPMSNRESVIHLQFDTASLPDSLQIIGKEAEEPLPPTPGLERVSDYYAVWHVTMPEENKLHIEYILKLDPGGGITPWMANLMVEKGPYETFKGLSEKLKALN
jgi:hypothetical protein